MIKFLFLFLISFNLWSQSYDTGLYWFKDGMTSTKSIGSNITGFYDQTKPTVIYFHGWQKDTCGNSVCRRENFMFTDPTNNASIDTVKQWKTDGWNVGVFYWNQFADEGEVKDAEAKIWVTNGVTKMRFRLPDGTYSEASAPIIPIRDIAYNEITSKMSSYSGTEIRFAGHSLGSQLAIAVAKKMSDANSKLMPERLELLDAFWSKDAKTYLKFTDGTMSTTCDKPTTKTNWPGEIGRCYISRMIAKNNIAVTWYKTSAIGDVGVGDSNSALRPIIVFQNCASPWWTATQQTPKHIWAKNLYFWSKIVPDNAKIYSYANTPTSKVLLNMKKTYNQDTNSKPNPTDDTYR